MKYRATYNSYRNNAFYGRIPGNVENPTFTSLSDVEKVLNSLKENIEKKGNATLVDFYKLTGGVVVTGDSEYGWFDLLSCAIHITRYGYELVMPTCIRIYSDPVRDAIETLESADEDNALDIVDKAVDYLRSVK